MLALTLMVGIVIDDAIIVLENIYRYMEEKDLPPFQAAIEGTREIGLAVMATTLSLLAVFLPIGFMGGIVGRFMSSFGFTASFAIAVSLLVSFTMTPMLSSRFIKVPAQAKSRRAPWLEGLEVIPVLRPLLHQDAGMVDGASQVDCRPQPGRYAQHDSALHLSWKKLRAGRRSFGISRFRCAPRKARRWPPP